MRSLVWLPVPEGAATVAGHVLESLRAELPFPAEVWLLTTVSTTPPPLEFVSNLPPTLLSILP